MSLRITYALLLTITAASCSAPPAAPLAAAGPAVSFDGHYEGTGAPTQIIQGCGHASHNIAFEVKGSQIWVHAHHHHVLDGTVDPSGQVTMQNAEGNRSLSGLIQGGTLSATETAPGGPQKLRGFYTDSDAVCTTTIQATRVSASPPDAASDDGSGDE